MIRSGLLTKLIVTSYENNQALLIPNQAVVRFNDEVFVYKMNDDNTVSKSYLKLGVIDNNMVEVLSGLSLGDMVVTKGQFEVSDGQRVSVKQ